MSESQRLLDNTDDVSFGTGAMRFADLTDHIDDANDFSRVEGAGARIRAKFFLQVSPGTHPVFEVGIIFYRYICLVKAPTP